MPIYHRVGFDHAAIMQIRNWYNKTSTVACDFVLCHFPVSHLVIGYFLISSQGLESRPCRKILYSLLFTVYFVYLSIRMLWLGLYVRIVRLFLIVFKYIGAVRLCTYSQGLESNPSREICEVYGSCHVSSY
jgi:hypothetical protein